MNGLDIFFGAEEEFLLSVTPRRARKRYSFVNPRKGWVFFSIAGGVSITLNSETKPLAAAEMTFKRIRVPGEEKVDVAALIASTGGMDWREAVKR